MSNKHVLIDGMAWLPKEALGNKIEPIKERLKVEVETWDFIPGEDDGSKVVNNWVESENYLGIPRAFYRLTSQGRLPRKFYTSCPKQEYNCEVTPRDKLQKEGVEAITNYLSADGPRECILQGATGIGKTVMSLMIAAKLGIRTLIIVEKSNLLHQWKSEIEDDDPVVFPDADVGIFQADTEEYKGKDIVIGMAQTLYNRSPDQTKPYKFRDDDEVHDIFEWPGLIVVDETHNFAAPTFSYIIQHFTAEKRLGCTATPSRRDNAENIFFHALGDIEWVGDTPKLTPKIYRVDTNFSFGGDYPKWIQESILARSSSRNQLIGRHINLARKKNRRILILTKRISHILLLEAKCKIHSPESSVGICSGSYYVDKKDAYQYLKFNNYQSYFRDDQGNIIEGKVEDEKHKIEESKRGKKVKPKRRDIKQEEFDKNKKKDIVIGTVQKVKEAFDEPSLDTLFIAMPIFHPTQAVGRILREHPDKKDPIVVHFVDKNVGVYWGGWLKCKKFYDEMGARYV